MINCPNKPFADDTKQYPEDENKLQDNIFSACAWSKKWEMRNVKYYTSYKERRI